MDVKKMQAQVREYDKRFGWDKDKTSHIVLHQMEELGEISRRIMRHEGYKTEKFDKDELGQEITDLLYLTLKLANQFNIQVEDEWETMWTRYKTKTSRI